MLAGLWVHLQVRAWAPSGGCLLQRVLHGAGACEGLASRPGLLECRVSRAGAQRGQDGAVVRGLAALNAFAITFADRFPAAEAY